MFMMSREGSRQVFPRHITSYNPIVLNKTCWVMLMSGPKIVRTQQNYSLYKEYTYYIIIIIYFSRNYNCDKVDFICR